MEGMTVVGCIGVKVSRDLEGDRGWGLGFEGFYGIKEYSMVVCV